MAIWKEQINISHLHRLYEEDKISVESLGKAVASRLRLTNYYQDHDPEIIEIICEFAALNKISELKDYEVILDMLYDFGDIEHRLLVETLLSGDDTDEDNITNTGVINYVDQSKRVCGYIYPYSKITCDIINCKTQHETHTSTTSQSGYMARRNNSMWSSSSHDTSPNELDIKLKSFEIAREEVSSEMYEYLRKSPPEYQNFLLERWRGFQYMEVKKVASEERVG